MMMTASVPMTGAARRVGLVRAAVLSVGLLASLVALAACGGSGTKENSPTAGNLVVYVDESYAPLLSALADTFMVRSPNAHVKVVPISSRSAVQSLLDAFARDTARTDSSLTYAIVIGRTLLDDERAAMTKGGLDVKEYMIAWDGLTVAVPVASPLSFCTREGLMRAIRSHEPTTTMLDSTSAAVPVKFLMADQNSGVYPFVRHQLAGDTDVAGPAHYFVTSDSVVAAVAAGEGIGIMAWYAAHRDSVRVRTLPLGYIDSTRQPHPAVRVHPISLASEAYPIKMPLVGYTYAPPSTPAIGFLAWLSRSQDAQYYVTYRGLQPANVKIRAVMPASDR